MIDISLAVPWAQVLGPALVCSSAVVALLSFYRANEIAKYGKKADVLMHCNLRYDELLKTMPAASKSSGVYERRYWALVSDQYEYFLLGYIDIEATTDWLLQTRRSALSESKSLGFNLNTSWASVGSVQHAYDPKFTALISELLSPGNPFTRAEVLRRLKRDYDNEATRRRRRAMRSGIGD